MIIIDVTILLIERGETPVEVFATVKSAGRNEYAIAGGNGDKMGLVFVMFSEEYGEQDEIEYDGKRFSIYRTFSIQNGDKIELYTEERVGTRV